MPNVSEMVYALGDGDNYFLDLRLPGHPTTEVVYVDHNMGTIVKDAFPADKPYGDVLAFTAAQAEPGVETHDIDPADARARISQAVDNGVRMLTSLESDTWAQLRPLVEWLLRAMPAGGTPYVRAESADAALERLASEFFASRHGARSMTRTTGGCSGTCSSSARAGPRVIRRGGPR